MLRITTQNADDEVVMRLEGCLAGAWVRELAVSWRETVKALHGRRLRVDLKDVCHADRPGQELMTEMYRAGTQFTAAGCVMPEIVREISSSAAGAAKFDK